MASSTINDDDKTASLFVHVPHGSGSRKVEVRLTFEQLLILTANFADAARKIEARRPR
jgi:hypothetical protein